MLNAELNSTYICVRLVQVCKGCVECRVDSFLCRAVRSVSKLVLVQVSRDGRFDVREDESLKLFGDYGGGSNWAIVIKAHCTFL